MYSGMSVDDIINQYAHKEGTMQARQLGYRDKRDNLKRVLKNLESIDFIGLSERFDDSLRLCNHTFGWNLQSIPKRNVGGYKAEVFSPEQSSKIEEACKIDYIIYNRGVEIFESRLAQIKKSPSKQSRG